MKQLGFGAILGLPLLLACYTPDSLMSLPSEQKLAAALFLSVVVLWVTEFIPLPATALLIPVLSSAYGLQSIEAALRPFGADILYLFLGAFFLAQALRKHQLDRRIAYFVLQLPGVSQSFSSVATAVFIISFTLSMWISNTATAVMLCPVAIGLSIVLKEEMSEKMLLQARTYLLLGIAFACGIGGMATPIGSPPNLIALAFLQNHGVSVSFFQWMSFALPIAAVCFVVMQFVLARTCKLREISIRDVTRLQTRIAYDAKSLGRLSAAERWTMGVFCIAVTLWLAPGILQSVGAAPRIVEWLQSHLPMTTVALGAGLILFILPAAGRGSEAVLDWSDAQQIDWGTIILFGGGLSLGGMLDSTGLSATVAQSLLAESASNPITLIFVASVAATVFTAFASNTATATVLVALLLGVLPRDGTIGVYAPVFAVALAASCSFVLPVSTPPNAIVYGTGAVPLRDMIKAGFLVNLAAWVIICLAMLVLLKVK